VIDDCLRWCTCDWLAVVVADTDEEAQARAAEAQELADLGINHLLVRFLGEWPGKTRHISEASMKLFSKEVMPRFKTGARSQKAHTLDLIN
jgi:hypothetical protein